MKFRIIKDKNNDFYVQKKRGFFYEWFEISQCFSKEQDAQEYLNKKIADYIIEQNKDKFKVIRTEKV